MAWLASLPGLQGFDGFAWPWLLLALPLPWLLRVLLPPVRGTTPALKVPYGDRIAAIAGARGAARRAHVPGVLAWLAWALLCLAAARPQQLGAPVQPPQAARDLMLAVDLSGSMRDEDMAIGGMAVDRLTAAKAVLADFLDRRAGDRVGLIVFGDRAYALTPLTRDLASVRQQLADTVVGLAGRATAIGDAIGLAVKRLRAQPRGERVLVLLTDGVNTAGQLDPLKAAAIARDADVRVHAIAFGGDGRQLSVFGMPIQLGGEDIDEATLQRIASLTGGRFFRARDTEQLAGIYAEIDRLEPIRAPGQQVRPRIERYPLPLGAALLCGVLALALPRRRRA
ncbi:MAG TPA: VWA domain-containing protein [Xanthomonadaceae bacterium]|nr:VWA domain-containing protein [Xanthomonadaceae bacterium]